MESILKFDKVVLVKELNEKFHKIGEVYEVANILNNNTFLLRDSKTRAAIGVVSFADFERCFVHEEVYIGWTQWTRLIGFDGQNDCMYRTNRKKTQVRFLTDKVMGESFLNKGDDFDLVFGLNLAYLRARNKAIAKKKAKYEKEVKNLDIELMDNERMIKDMINHLES